MSTQLIPNLGTGIKTDVHSRAIDHLINLYFLYGHHAWLRPNDKTIGQLAYLWLVLHNYADVRTVGNHRVYRLHCTLVTETDIIA